MFEPGSLPEPCDRVMEQVRRDRMEDFCGRPDLDAEPTLEELESAARQVHGDPRITKEDTL